MGHLLETTVGIIESVVQPASVFLEFGDGSPTRFHHAHALVQAIRQHAEVVQPLFHGRQQALALFDQVIARSEIIQRRARLVDARDVKVHVRDLSPQLIELGLRLGQPGAGVRLCGVTPLHLGAGFLELFQRIVDPVVRLAQLDDVGCHPVQGRLRVL